jgi:hypothetical protein
MTVVTSVLTLPGRPESARAAREFTAACMPGCPSAYEAMLCVDELVANAVQHSRSGASGGEITVRVTTEPGEWVRAEVEDQGPRLRVVPEDPDEAGELAEHGRGLDLVALLADETGAGAGLRWFRMAWGAQACVPAPRPRLTAAELRRHGVPGRAGGMCECGGRCGRAGHRCGYGEAPGYPLYVVAADPARAAVAAALPAAELVALCPACLAGRDRLARRAAASAAPAPDALFAVPAPPGTPGGLR